MAERNLRGQNKGKFSKESTINSSFLRDEGRLFYFIGLVPVRESLKREAMQASS